MTVKDFIVGQRVQLHPSLDWWMRGARYGTVEKVGRKNVTVRLDAVERAVPLPPNALLEVY